MADIIEQQRFQDLYNHATGASYIGLNVDGIDGLAGYEMKSAELVRRMAEFDAAKAAQRRFEDLHMIATGASYIGLNVDGIDALAGYEMKSAELVRRMQAYNAAQATTNYQRADGQPSTEFKMVQLFSFASIMYPDINLMDLPVANMDDQQKIEEITRRMRAINPAALSCI